MSSYPTVEKSVRDILGLTIRHAHRVRSAYATYTVVVLDQNDAIVCRFGPFDHIDWKRRFCCEKCIDPAIRCRWVVEVSVWRGLNVQAAKVLFHPFAAAGEIQCWPSVWKGDPSDLLRNLEIRARQKLVRESAGKSLSNPSGSPRPNEVSYSSNKVYDIVWQKPSSPPPEVITNLPYVSKARTWTGTTTPNYGRLKDRGLLPVNDHSVQLFEKDDAGYHKEQHHFDSNGEEWAWSLFGQTFDHIAGALPSVPSHLDGVYDRALARVAGNASSIDANIAQDVGELSQTTRMISNHVRRITQSLRALKRGNASDAIRILLDPRSKRRSGGANIISGGIAKAWLELQYGWKPLLKDIEIGVEKIRKADLSRVVVKVARASTRSEGKDATIVASEGPSWEVGTRYTYTTTTVRLGVRYKIADPLVSYLAQFGFTNPINLGWELLPFSFVYDWLHPIGSYLSALSQWDGLVFVDGYKVEFTRQRISGRINFSIETAHEGLGPYTNYSIRGAQEVFGIRYDRTKLSSFPSPTIPSPKMHLTVTRGLNALALLRVLVGR